MVEVLGQVGRHSSRHCQSARQSHYGRSGCCQGRVIPDALASQFVDNLLGHNGIGAHIAKHLEARLITIRAQFLAKEGHSVNFHSWHFQYGCQNLVPN